MAFTAWRRWWCGKSASTCTPRPRRLRAPLGVRQLETRLTPSLATLASFVAPNGVTPQAPVIVDGSGNLYGTTVHGGAFGEGTVFEIAKGSGAVTTLASFSSTTGQFTPEALMIDGSGNLYGTTYGGGAFGEGTVFELAKGSGTITTLASFTGTDGALPFGAVIMDGGGNLYGTTLEGGPSWNPAGGVYGDGTVFEITHGSGTITTLASFNGTNGDQPVCALVMDGSGNLYGTTEFGGATWTGAAGSGDGTVFELAKGSGTITTLASFNGTDGTNPEAGLVMDGSGNLYGTTTGGGASSDGTVFEVAQGSGTITDLAAFNGTDGDVPYCALVLDGSGNLYGTTNNGGASGDGTVFELAVGSGTITDLASFNGTDGQGTFAGLAMDGSGNLYGTTYQGSAPGYGTVFELAQGSGTITTLASFGYTGGVNPQAGVVMDAGGNLYGTTTQGGAYNAGTVFELAHGSGAITVLASFNGTDGATPEGGLILDGSGNLYGTTFSGGASGEGTVFEVAAGSGTITTLASFNATDGEYPYAGLTMDSSGNLYGTAYAGGAFGYGTVFELAKGSGTITTLASFDGTNGRGPYAGVTMDSNGNLYGTTYGTPPRFPGSKNYGTVFELAKGSGTITTLASFNGTDGANPNGALILDSRGNLYGTTLDGGPAWNPNGHVYGDGSVFEVVQGSGTITTLASFNGTDGQTPHGALVLDGSGNLYGSTAGGGASGAGTVFELAAGSGNVTTLVSFNGTDGQGANGGLMMDTGGNLYGTTSAGGVPGLGTVFELPGAAVADQWTGANFAVDTNWSDGANWSLGAPPSPGQTVLFTNNASVKSFTSTVDAAFTNPIGVLHIDGTWGGTVAVTSPLSVAGDFTLASGSFGGSGAVTLAGSGSQWTGGQIVVGSGGFTNNGTLTADTTGGNLVLGGAGTLTNDGTITEAGTNSLVLENTATLSNVAGATFDLTNNGSVSQSGGGTFTNAGTLEKTGGTGTSTLATTTLSNTGIVSVTSGTLDIGAAVSQVSGTTLTAGTWAVTGSATVHSKLDITSAGSFTTLGAAAQVTLDGLNTSFTNLRGLRTIAAGAGFSLLDGQAFTTTGALTDKGALTLGAGTILTVSGSFTQASTGTLTIELGGTDTAPAFGQLVSTTGTVKLAGHLAVTSTAVPAVGSSLDLLDNEGNSAISGVFAGLPEGSKFTVTVGTTTMTFKISYVGKDSDGKHNVVITRTA